MEQRQKRGVFQVHEVIDEVLAAEARFPDAARTVESYKRLKKRFGDKDQAEGFSADALTLRDLFDISTLYFVLSIQRVDASITPEALMNLGYVVDIAAGTKNEKDPGLFSRCGDILISHIPPGDRIFDHVIDLQGLMTNPGSPSGQRFEIAHGSGGIFIAPSLDDHTRYEIVLPDRNAPIVKEAAYVKDVLREVGLPVRLRYGK